MPSKAKVYFKFLEGSKHGLMFIKLSKNVNSMKDLAFIDLRGTCYEKEVLNAIANGIEIDMV